MKLLIVGRKIRYNAEYFYNKAFSMLGIDVEWLDSYEGVTNPFISRTIHSRSSFLHPLLSKYPINKSLPGTVSSLDPDAIIIFKGEFISNETLEEISKNHKTYLFYPDNYRFKPLLKDRLHYFNAIFTAANKTDKYSKMGAKRTVTVPWACEPSFHRKIPIESKYKVTFIGTSYPERRKIIRNLQNVEVFGNYWYGFGKIAHPPVSGEDYIKTINESFINLNLQGKGSISADSPTMRTFEIAGSGCFQISDYMPSLTRYFPELVTFKKITELTELINYFSEQGEETEIISERIQGRAYKHYTYIDSARKILNSL